MDVFQEVGLGSGEDDAVHPSLVVSAGNEDRSEEASLAGTRPPSSYRSACGQRQSTFYVDGYVF